MVPGSGAADFIDFETGADRVVSEQSFTPSGHAGVMLADAFGSGLRLASLTDCVLSPTNELCVAVSDNFADGVAPSALRIDFPANDSPLWLPNDEPSALWCSFAEVAWPPRQRTRPAAFSGLC